MAAKKKAVRAAKPKRPTSAKLASGDRVRVIAEDHKSHNAKGLVRDVGKNGTVEVRLNRARVGLRNATFLADELERIPD